MRKRSSRRVICIFISISILHPQSSILNPSFFVLHSSSFILHPASLILPPSLILRILHHPSSFVLHPLHPPSFILNPPSFSLQPYSFQPSSFTLHHLFFICELFWGSLTFDPESIIKCNLLSFQDPLSPYRVRGGTYKQLSFSFGIN